MRSGDGSDDLQGGGREQQAESGGSLSDVADAIRRTISNVTAVSSQIADTHFQYTRRRAGFGVGATTAWALANAVWKLSTPALNAIATGVSSCSGTATTVGLAAATGMLGTVADIGTCFAKREETKDTLNKFIAFMQEAQRLDLIENVHYKKSLIGSKVPLEDGQNIQDAWKGCVEMEIKLTGRAEPIKLSNVENLGSKYMLMHSVALLASLSIYAANLGITGEGLHEIMSRNATMSATNATTSPEPLIPPSTASTIAALGTLPIITFVNWFTTLCLQQEKQIAEASRFLLTRPHFEGNPHGQDQLIDLLAKLEVFTPSQLVAMSSRPQGSPTLSNTGDQHPPSSLGDRDGSRMSSNQEAPPVVDAAAEIAFSVLTSGEQGHHVAADAVQGDIQDAVVMAARGIGLSGEAVEGVIDGIHTLFAQANRVVDGVDQIDRDGSGSHISEGQSLHSTESRGESIAERLLGVQRTLADGYRTVPERGGQERHGLLKGRSSAPPPSSGRDLEMGLDKDDPPSPGSAPPDDGSSRKDGRKLW